MNAPQSSSPTICNSPQRSTKGALAAQLPRQTPPGPRGSWLWGNLREYRSGRLPFLERLRAEYGSMVSYRLGRHAFVLVSEPRWIEQVLVTRNREFSKFYITKMLRDVFGQGLLTSEGSFWLKQRRLIQPTFAQANILELAGAMVRQTETHVQGWDSAAPRDMLREMQSLTMAIAADTLLGVELPEECAAIHEPHNALRANFDRRVESLFTLPSWMPTPHNLKMRRALRSIQQIVERLIAQRRQGTHEGRDILSRLLAAQGEGNERMTDVQVRDEALTFLFAGHETTASVLAWTWYALARHPHVEAKLHAELDSVLGRRWPTAHDVPRLSYTEAVFRETLRLYPSSYGIGRRALADCELGGYRISRGTNVMLSQWLTHRDERFFDRPLEFRPERWTAEFQKSLPHFAWFPFGGGPRTCIGNTFAMFEGVMVIAALASRLQFALVPGQNIQPYASLTLRPSPSVMMTGRSR